MCIRIYIIMYFYVYVITCVHVSMCTCFYVSVITCFYVYVHLYLRNGEKLSFQVLGWGSNFVE